MASAASGLPIITVDTLIDEKDGDLSAGDVSLREALSVVAAGGVINFADSLAIADAGFGQGVMALTAELVVDKSVTIEGLGADRLTISGNGESRVFRLDDGDAAISSDVLISGLTVADGDAATTGGILTAGENLTFVDAAMNGTRGAIAVTAAANIMIERSSIFNSRDFGIRSLGQLRLSDSQLINSEGVSIQHSGTLTLESSWVANGAASGIVSDGALALINSQVASHDTSGIDVRGGTVTLRNSAVTGNRESGITSDKDVSLTLLNSAVESNEADGVVTRGNTLIENSSIVNNGGGGVTSERVTILSGIVFGNSGTGVLGRVVEISDSEISNNVDGDIVRVPVLASPAEQPLTPDVVKIGGNKEANKLRGTAQAERILGYGGNDNLNGKGGNDVLEGGNGDDKVIGGDGDDILGGGRGRDLLRGGAGRDTFVYNQLNEGNDVILDFEVGQDLIDLSAIFSGQKSGPNYNSSSTFDSFVKLTHTGASVTVSVLDANRSNLDAPVFQKIAQLKNVELADVTISSFVL